MSKKKWQEREQPPVIVFTTETVNLTLKALALFDQSLQRADHQDEKVAFAEETMRQVKHKLERMKDSVSVNYLAGFDFNEKITIRYAMLTYTIELLAQPPGQKRDTELRQCRVIARNFTDDEKAAH